MKTCRAIPILLAVMLAAAPNASAQEGRNTDPESHYGGEHGPAGLFEELEQWGYTEAELAAINDHMEAIHESIDEIMGLHDHEAPDRDMEEVRRAGESALMRFHDAYESLVVGLEEEHARALTAMVFEHLFHIMAPRSHDGEGHPDIGGENGHG